MATLRCTKYGYEAKLRAKTETSVQTEDLSAPIDPKAFTNKTVLILGKGQSAFETANHIYGETARIDMISRQRPKMAFQTHCKIDTL